jgi:hypothetical protein
MLRLTTKKFIFSVKNMPTARKLYPVILAQINLEITDFDDKLYNIFLSFLSNSPLFYVYL